MTPINLSYVWNLGSMLGFLLLVQIVSGVLLSFHYQSGSVKTFNSVIEISREVNKGWLLRNTHANGASMMFLCIYLHIGKALFYGSYNKTKLWFSGLIILILVMATAFLGYVLPWGQMSFWGATVITNFFSAVPYVGNQIVWWVWGGFSVSEPTLNRFFGLHFLLPFIILGFVVLHIFLLHKEGSNNEAGIEGRTSNTTFHPYYTTKDLLGFYILMIMFSILIFFFPWELGESENFIENNPLSTPEHIVPEWYFLFAYAVLRCIPNKLMGLISLILTILVLFTIPVYKESNVKSSSFKPITKVFLFCFLTDFILLTWIGGKPVEGVYINLSIYFSIAYFVTIYFTTGKLPKLEKLF
jgi:ubiquinol-cytochrome c reductase cytochrome b subunit